MNGDVMYIFMFLYSKININKIFIFCLNFIDILMEGWKYLKFTINNYE